MDEAEMILRRTDRMPKATESITSISECLSQQQVEAYYIPLVNRLSRGEWFTSRTSSAALYSPVYSKVSPQIKDDMRRAFVALAGDDTPMVRRAAAKWLGVCARNLFSLIEFLIIIFWLCLAICKDFVKGAYNV